MAKVPKPPLIYTNLDWGGVFLFDKAYSYDIDQYVIAAVLKPAENGYYPVGTVVPRRTRSLDFVPIKYHEINQY